MINILILTSVSATGLTVYNLLGWRQQRKQMDKSIKSQRESINNTTQTLQRINNTIQ